jgi:hypothetical protein
MSRSNGLEPSNAIFDFRGCCWKILMSRGVAGLDKWYCGLDQEAVSDTGQKKAIGRSRIRKMNAWKILLPIIFAAFALTVGWIMPVGLPLALLVGVIGVFIAYCGFWIASSVFK